MTIASDIYDKYTHNGITNNCDLIEKCESIATSVDYGEDPERDYLDVTQYFFEDKSCIVYYPTIGVVEEPIIFN